jgi:hypothetical protein
MYISNFFKDNIDFHKKLFKYGLYLSYTLTFFYIVIIIGLGLSSSTNIDNLIPKWISTLKTFQTFYISLFLIWNFNPFNNKNKNKNDEDFNRNVAFHAGLFLLTSTSLVTIIEKYFEVPNVLI